MPSREREPNALRKGRGGYYTDAAAAAAICAWAVRGPADRVLDPSFGEGAFLVAAAQRLEALGGSEPQVHGVEVDPEAYAVGAHAAAAARVSQRRLARGDFFDLDRAPSYEAVVGNPPFVRFQRFRGDARRKAAQRAASAGVELSPLASAWAAFVVHAAGFVRQGGRLGMLLPAEIGQADYSREVLRYLVGAFGGVTVVAFGERLFPGLDQDAVALLADRRGSSGGRLRYARMPSVADLPGAEREACEVDLPALLQGERTLRFFELDQASQRLYRRLERNPRIRDVATVTSGYVSGANRYFHLSPEDAASRQIGPSARTRAVFRSRALDGLAFDQSAWRRATVDGAAGYLFTPPPEPDPAVRAYVELGEARGIHRGYKARHRARWNHVPRVLTPDLLLPAMAPDTHALAVNAVEAAPANTLHAVSIRRGGRRGDAARSATTVQRLARAMAVAWHTAASRLSRELEGRVLGGGMLKLEPGEAGRVLLPGVLDVPDDALDAAFAEVDRRLRSGDLAAARRVADLLLLRDVVGLREDDIVGLARAVDMLRALRRRGGATAR